MPPRINLPLAFILITMVIDAMGIGLILPVMPALIQQVDGGTLADAAIWGGVLSFSFAVMQFLFSPLMGALSDRFGRRPVLLGSLFIMAADYVVMALAGSIWLLLAGRLVGGVTAATQSTASAFIADISSREARAARFGLIGAAFGVGFVLGPLIGGLLAGFGTRAPFWAAAALTTANLIFGALVLPETVTARTRRAFMWRRANPFGAFRHLARLPGIGRLVVVFFLYQVGFNVYPAVWAYFTKARFGWEAGMIGVSLAAFGISMALVQGVLIRIVLRRFGEARTVLIGMAVNICGFCALAVLTNGTIALLLTPLNAVGVIVTPALQGIMSRQVSDDSQGELQGVLTSAGALAMIVSPLLMTQVFATFTAPDAPVYLPGAPFVLSVVLMISAAAVYLGKGRPRAA